jgi:hypothetical protein
MLAFIARMIKNTAQFLLIASLCLGSLQAAAKAPLGYNDPNPMASANICQMKAEDFLEKAEHPGNLTQNSNADGPLYTGLCWWHTKMQRAALYLAVFDQPNKPKPTQQEAYDIFAKLRDLEEVVSIPGFKNWSEFTAAFRVEFYQMLAHWEVRDVVQLQFLKGIRASGATDISTLQKISDEVNDYKRLTFVLLKWPMIPAHSWIVQSFERQGAEIKVGFIDSNIPQSINQYDSKGNAYQIFDHTGYDSEEGRYLWSPVGRLHGFPEETGFVSYSKTPITFYLQNDNLDFQKISNAVQRHCGQETPFTLHEKEVVKRKIQKEFERQNWYRPGSSHN